MAEMSVGCEACHGPLKAHNEWQQRFGASGKQDPTLLRLTRQQTMENCAFCHARRSDLTGDFKPGDLFSDNMEVALVDRTDTFYADGQVHEEDYEYSAFLGSRMHAKNVICTDCHNPHTAKTILPGNWLCLRCHAVGSTIAPPINPVLHSHHKVFGFDGNGTVTNLNLLSYDSRQVKETGGECVNCHMPQTVYMQRHWRHDHGFTIPDPLLTRDAGIPNACNRCHQDKDADWALKSCEKWYGDKMNRPTRKRAEIIIAAKRGDPGAYEGLLSILSGEEIPYWRTVAAGLLEPWLDKPAVQTALLRELSDTNDLVRSESVRVLESLVTDSNSVVVAALRERLADPVREVRIAAAWALAASVDHSSPAWNDLERMLEVNADQPTGQMQKGELALMQGDPARAVGYYAKAVEWDPSSAGARHDYAVVLSQMNQPAKAMEQMETACRLEPKNGELQYELALAYHAAGEDEKVIPTLRNALLLDSTLAPAWYNLGLALSSAGESSEALEALGRAESLAPEARIPYARATILARLGRIAEAKSAARRALELQPDFQPAQELLRVLGTSP
jgi:tetratricopeptide (TPR) repeat protein